MRHILGFPPVLSDDLKSNFVQLYWDIGWWGLYIGATYSFLTIYAVRCGATPEQVGLLTALPAMLSLVLSLPAGRLLKRFPARQATVLFAFFARSLLIIYVILPWILPPTLQVKALLVMSVVLAIPNTVIGISFNQFFMEAVPGEWRGLVVGRRNAIMSMVSFPVTLICGQILTYLVFPSGYQVMFLIGFIGAIMTVYQLWRVHPVPGLVAPAANSASMPSRRLLPGLDAAGRSYLRVLGLLFLVNLTTNMATPLIPNLLVNTLHLSDAMISLGTATTSILVFVVSLLVARMTRRTGNRIATGLGGMLLALQVVALALARDATLYLLSAVVGGIATGILGVAQFNYNLDNLPPAERSAWLSWSLLLGNAAILLGALSGPAVAQIGGTSAALIFLGVLRVAVGLAILKWG
jgi:MFS family permease